MWKYILKRVLQLIPVFLFVTFIVYWLMSLSGDPAAVLAGNDATPEQLEILRKNMGLDQPLILRYLKYMFNLLRGDMGKDIYGNSVWDQFAARFPYTIGLVLITVVGSSIIGIVLGIVAALHRGTWGDTLLTAVSLFFHSMPVFWLAMILQSIFAIKLRWFPTSGIARGLAISLVLPAATSILHGMAGKTRPTRSAMLDNLNADFMRTALAKGVRYRRAVWKHAFPNAAIPIITVIGSHLTIAIGGSATLETVFAWPGIGSLIIPAVRQSNYPLVCGCVTVTLMCIGVINLLVDIAYAFFDPRIKARYTGK